MRRDYRFPPYLKTSTPVAGSRPTARAMFTSAIKVPRFETRLPRPKSIDWISGPARFPFLRRGSWEHPALVLMQKAIFTNPTLLAIRSANAVPTVPFNSIGLSIVCPYLSGWRPMQKTVFTSAIAPETISVAYSPPGKRSALHKARSLNAPMD